MGGFRPGVDEPVSDVVGPGREQPPRVLVDLVGGLVRNDLDRLVWSDIEPRFVAAIRDVLRIKATLELVEGNEERRSTTHNVIYDGEMRKGMRLSPTNGELANNRSTFGLKSMGNPFEMNPEVIGGQILRVEKPGLDNLFAIWL